MKRAADLCVRLGCVALWAGILAWDWAAERVRSRRQRRSWGSA